MARKKKEVVEINTLVKTPIVNRYQLSHDKAYSLWDRALKDLSNVGIGEFLSSLGFTTVLTPKESVTVGGFLMHFETLFPEDKVKRKFFSWIQEIMSSTLVVWGVTSSTITDWVHTENEQELFYKFLTAWGYAMFKHPDNADPFPDYVSRIMREKDLLMW